MMGKKPTVKTPGFLTTPSKPMATKKPIDMGMAPKAKPAPMVKAPKPAMPAMGVKPSMPKGKMAPAAKPMMPKRTKM